ncbi:MAG: UDP-N-acetylmuramoyl-L-alanyl-D-glutamate--2,6-diaminopimelate ligase [Bacilli bacterium]
MKKLKELINTEIDCNITGIKTNSKEILKGDLFICIDGITDRHLYIDDAIKRGASAVIGTKDLEINIPYIKVDNIRNTFTDICKKFYDFKDNELFIIGVTGTDGKTSVCSIIQTLIGKDKCGYIGTNGRSCKYFDKPTDNTTPDQDKLFYYFKEFRDLGIKYIVMETSSEAFYNNRLNNLTFNASIITNITTEHLNTHKTLENYIKCKSMLFKQTNSTGISILNKDDEHFKEINASTSCPTYTYGKDNENELQIISFILSPSSTIINFKYKDEIYKINSPLLGDFNVYNLSASILILLKMGYSFNEILSNIKDININGRLDMIDMDQDYYAMVDYAHTENGVKKLINFVKTLNLNKIIVVMGSAGERDKTKRPKIGEIILDNVDKAIFTYEDPRSENPIDIINEIISTRKNNTNYEIVIDRKEAIKRAIEIAQENDIVLVLGKGNETYQKLSTGKIYFCDEEEVREAIQEKLNKNKDITLKLK